VIATPVTVCVCVCVCVLVCRSVRTLKGKGLELSTPNLVHIILYGNRSARNDPEVKRSKIDGYENRQGCMAAGGCCVRCATAAGVELHVA